MNEFRSLLCELEDPKVPRRQATVGYTSLAKVGSMVWLRQRES